MVLFLTSSPCDDDVPAHMHLPCCYFTRNEFVANLKKHWKQDPHMVMIAANPDAYDRNDEMAFTFRRCFFYHGMVPETYILLDGRNKEQTKELVKRADFILLGGGHVPTQMEFFNEIHLAEYMKDFDGVVMGISAGSMNAAKRVYAMPEEPGEGIDPHFVKHFPGLGLTKYNIIPHYNREKDNMLDGFKLFEELIYPDSHGEEYYVLNDGSYIMQADGNAYLYGDAWLMHDGKLTKICGEEESIKLD